MKIRKQTHEDDPPNDEAAAAPWGDDSPTSVSMPASEGSGSDGHSAYAEPGQFGSQRPPRRLALFTAVGLVAAVIGGGIGAATYAGITNDNPTPASNPAPVATRPASTTSNATSADTGVEQVAKEVSPRVVLLQVQGAKQADEGSGIVLSAGGNILTNNHVITAAAHGGKIRVQFSNGSSAPAKVVGTDPITDLAVVHATGVSGLKPAQLGNSADLKVGEPVAAFGAPLGLQGTVTSGIVSAVNRPVSSTGESGQGSVTDAIQTDAPINPGNSGGPLVDMSGHVIGIDSSIASMGGGSGTQSGSIGLGFAIPINQAQRIANELSSGKPATHAQLGVSVADSTNQVGALLHSVSKSSPASAAGMKTGDVITKVNNQIIDQATDLVAAIRAQKPGAKVTIHYTRGGSNDVAKATLGSTSQQNS